MLNANEIEVLEILESCHVTPYGDLTDAGKTALAMWREV